MRLAELSRQIRRLKAELPDRYTSACVRALRALLAGEPFEVAPAPARSDGPSVPGT
jgi:hypothetical protein